ncbi:transposase [Fischerella sp.]|uniref:transposase n=1 Tax=Fischerella sp. TaxID=1191 RepID=UPI0025C2DBB1|nr:transposase [Fischerella sp.]
MSIDLWQGYKKLVTELMPNAQLVADRFHVMAQINQELDTQRKTAHCDMHFMYALRIPSLTEGDCYFSDIVQRAAKLICTTPEFDELAIETLNLTFLQCGITEESDRAKLRAELDGMIAHLYNLTEAEFAYILSTFPIVPEQVK